MILLGLLGWRIVGSGQSSSDTAQEGMRIVELRGRITYLHEFLTMSARMAAASGDPRWVQRFQNAAPALDAAIEEAVSLASPETRSRLAATVVEAHRDLMQMERTALTLTQGGRADEGRNLLNGADFSYLQAVYVGGTDAFGRDLEDGVNARANLSKRRNWLWSGGFSLLVILLVTGFMTAQQRVRLHMANGTDVLTQLPNRRQFYASLAAVLQRQAADDFEPHVLAIIGIDHFKVVNDTYGNIAADRLLQCVAERLRSATLHAAILARVGGDEFAVLMEAAAPSSLSDDCPIGRLMAALSPPYAVDDNREVSLGFSAGAVWISKQADVADAMRQAGTALSQAKADGRGRFRIFDHAMDERSRNRARLEADLRQAVERGDIVPVFQPLMDLRTQTVVGVEALARWYHAERGWVSPAQFIPMAEDLGLIGGLMEQLLRKACEAALSWPEHVTVAFNVSPLQLRDDGLPEQIRTILAQTGFPASRLEVEVTESALVEDLDLARTLLEDLRRSGVRLALDDFGTGYSSLKHLRCLPFDKLKIDASFVGGMADDRESGKIVAAVVGLGHSLGLSTVAEGVETGQVAALLQELGCDIGQGWFFGRPVPAAELVFLPSEVEKPVLAA